MDRRQTLVALGSLALGACASSSERPRHPSVFDGLSYLPDDLSQLQRAHLTGCIFDVSAGETLTNSGGERRYIRTFEACERSIDCALARLAAAPEITLVRRSGQLRQTGRILAILQFQAAEPIGSHLDRIAYFQDKGLRVLQITHNHTNEWGAGYLEPAPGGLTALGVEGLAELNRLRIVPDVSHASEQTALEVARRSCTPFIVSHSACRAVFDNPRCASDELIRALANRGGAMGVFMMSMFLTAADEPVPGDFVAHIKHLVKVGGIGTAAIANDYPVAGLATARSGGNAEAAHTYHEWWAASHARGIPGFARLPLHAVIPDFNSLQRVEVIQEALAREGFRASEIDKIMGENWLRVFRETLPA